MRKKTLDEVKRMFFYHVANGHASAIRKAVSHGMDPDTRNNSGETPLHVACYLGQADSVQVLLSAGADPYEKDDLGRTPRDRAEALSHNPARELIIATFDMYDDELLTEKALQEVGLSR